VRVALAHQPSEEVCSESMLQPWGGQFKRVSRHWSSLARTGVASADLVERGAGRRGAASGTHPGPHDYCGVDFELVWDVVQTRVPELRNQLASILKA
jgi:hypothetical protein